MQEPEAGLLTIGELASRTGLSPATLRMWESRHGFPTARRLQSGHRRYDEAAVDSVLHVLRRKDAGVRLEVAIREALEAGEPTPPSVFAELRRRHPELAPQRLRKSTLVALSHAIEDECCARAQQPLLVGAFQEQRHYLASRDRWVELAAGARAALVLADLPPGEEGVDGDLLLVSLARRAPMRREWLVACDAPDLPAVLTAWELPGQAGVPDADRVFESMWTVHPGAVRAAARVCARVAADSGSAVGGALGDLSAPVPDGLPDPVAAAHLFNRVVAYVDRRGR